MLAQLSVKNLAVVEHLELSFETGMSSVTGETGSGKSILIQALSFALGTRGDSTVVRHGKSKAEISAVFEVKRNKKIQSYLQKQGLDDDGECILRRVIGVDGRSKAFINGSSVPLSTVRQLGELLIDIHGQNEHQLLLRQHQQIELVDDYASISQEISELNYLVSKYKKASKNLELLLTNQNSELENQELIKHQLKELDDALLTQEELDSIESEYKVNSNSNNLIEMVGGILNKLEDESGPSSQLQSLSHELSQASAIDNKLEETNDLLVSTHLQSQECIYFLTSYLNSITIDEQATAELEERLTELHGFARKHNCKISELLRIREGIKTIIGDFEIGFSMVNRLKEEKEKYENEYKLLAQKIREARLIKSSELSKLVTSAMQVLGMPGSEFKAKLTEKTIGVNFNGTESVDFLVRTNDGQPLQPLKKVASGGELSRVSLAISVVSADSEYAPTLIFDEVDVGISGAIAEVVGHKLKELSQHYQVICITHLAQVASFGHQHLRVSKVQQGDGASTTVEQLSKNDRVLEVARILGGITITEKARKAAAEMIQKSA
ncbi:MAG TPA: DNA repair protein RecN [Candidatus Thioglobus sp.]|jgi:DNA repair protein RecN (Recombination protein N)|nr:DNA repair protein RecN [Candidatus Thioglobus sp.]HIL43311.1 DNA repair protein RecN [Gammaproteobacteria bacterium]